MNAQTRLSPLTAVEEAQPALSLVAPRRGALPDDPGLVGRDRELRALEDFLREARAHGAARVVCGHAGAGKSALLEATVQAAATGMRVLRCTGIRGSYPPDLSGLLQIVWPVLADPHRPDTAGLLDALERVLVDGAPAPGGPSWLPFAVLRVLESVSRAGQP
ncbi:AAA family ATPase, partial [Streptomyces olivaceoviridis]